MMLFMFCGMSLFRAFDIQRVLSKRMVDFLFPWKNWFEKYSLDIVTDGTK